MTRPVQVATAFLALCLASACTSDGGAKPPPAPATLRETACPSDVEILLFSPATCAVLTVPSQHDRSDGGTMQLFVLRFAPIDADPTAEPLLSFGGDLGFATDVVTLGAQVEGLGREVIAVDMRGVGHSTPSLGCPEVTALPVEPSSLPAGSPKVLAAFDDAVRRCRQRIVGEGVDLSAFDLSEMAADMVDLRTAMGIDRWAIMSTGTTSRILLEYLRSDAEHVSAAALDSPVWPGTSAPEFIGSTDRALRHMESACATDRPCRGLTSHLRADVDTIMARLRHQPVVFRYGDRGEVRLDAGHFATWLRARLAFIRPPGTFVPRTIAAATSSIHSLKLGASRLLGDRLCQGFLPNCWTQVAWSAGAYLSVLCRDIVPFDAPAETAGSTPGGFAATFEGGSPWTNACDTWDAGTGDPRLAQPVGTDVPILVLLGAFDPYSARGAVPGELSTSHLSVVTSPVNGHSVTGTEQSVPNLCMVRLRNTWLANPTSTAAKDCGGTEFDYTLRAD